MLNAVRLLLVLIVTIVSIQSTAQSTAQSTTQIVTRETLPVAASTDVIIIGGGPGGFGVADELRRAGVDHIVLEREPVGGGRVRSRQDRLGMGLFIDDGPNLINSSDKIALGYMHRYGIRYVQRIADGGEHMAYQVGNRRLTQHEMENLIYNDPANLNALTAYQKDHDARENGVENAALNEKLKNITVSQYLKELGATHTLRKTIDSFFWSEYGKHNSEVNGHVLHDYLDVHVNKKSFHFIPNVDEAFTVPGGTDQVIRELAKENQENIRYQSEVIAVDAESGGTRVVTVRLADGRFTTYRAKDVVFAAPPHTLNSIDINVPDFDASVIEEARATTFGSGTKLHLIFGPGFRELYKFRGILVTDTGEQIWTSSQGQKGEAGLLTVLTGPLSEDEHVVNSRIQRILTQLEVGTPGVSRLYVGYDRSNAPHTYSGPFRPGESRERRMNGSFPHWFMVGEASAGNTSAGDLQGYLEGAFQRGHDVAKFLIENYQGLGSKVTPIRKNKPTTPAGFCAEAAAKPASGF